MIQASAKHLNLGINFKTPPCNRSNKTLSNGKVWSPHRIFSNPFPSAFSNFTQENFLLPDGKITSPTGKKYTKKIETLTFIIKLTCILQVTVQSIIIEVGPISRRQLQNNQLHSPGRASRCRRAHGICALPS